MDLGYILKAEPTAFPGRLAMGIKDWSPESCQGFDLCDFLQLSSTEVGKTVDKSDWEVKIWNSISKILNLSCVEYIIGSVNVGLRREVGMEIQI